MAHKETIGDGDDDSEEQQALFPDDNEGEDARTVALQRYQRLVRYQFAAIVGLCCLLLLVLPVLLFRHRGWSRPHIPTQVYSPVDHLVTYKDVVFTSGLLEGRTSYQGPPTPERDAAWEDLYSFGVSRIPRSSAGKLVNKTLPIPDDPGYYIIELNVFHQLHCLNMLRLRLYSTEEYAMDHPTMGSQHLEHCVDAIRQSLMCSADTAPHSWSWDIEAQQAKVVAGVLHTCKDFDAIRDWARENEAGYFNTSRRVEQVEK